MSYPRAYNGTFGGLRFRVLWAKIWADDEKR